MPQIRFVDPSKNPITVAKGLVIHQIPEQCAPTTYGLWGFSTLNGHKSRPRKTIYPRCFQFYGISHHIEGTGWYWTKKNGRTMFEQGTAIISTPDFVQDYSGWETSYAQDAISFAGALADHLYNVGFIRDGLFAIGRTRRLLPIIKQLQEQSLNSQIKAAILLQKLLVDLADERLEVGKKEQYPLIERWLEEFRANPKHWWTATEMAEFSGLSLCQFRRVFRQKTGYSPKQYIDRHRIQYAAGILRSSQSSIADIAAQFGYSDQGHFSRRFKQIIGHSPDSYRHQLQEMSNYPAGSQ
jgi:AraC-like DNA-binding protein